MVLLFVHRFFTDSFNSVYPLDVSLYCNKDGGILDRMDSHLPVIPDAPLLLDVSAAYLWECEVEPVTDRYKLVELLLFLFFYAFLGWAVGVGYGALKDGRYRNRGLLNLPLAISEGITAVLLLLALPTLEGHLVWQFLLTWIIVWTVDALTVQFMAGVSRRRNVAWVQEPSVSPAVTAVLRSAEALLYLMGYLLLHPFVHGLVAWLPDWLAVTAVAVLSLITVADYFGVRYALRRGDGVEQPAPGTFRQRMGERMTAAIWDRLENAYPGICRAEPEGENRFVFARGLCFDKLVWVFLASSFLGALIEMVFCRVTGGTWMSRSSLVFGPFSVVWGLGAVILTVVLRRMAEKPDRHVFLTGFLVGGVYEYLCSVFTEVIYGTVFWDYSYIPLNLGGRINVLYCVFWGLLAVVWIRILYPPMDRAIEKVPPLMGKVVTWILVVAMTANCLVTSMAMTRYTQRQADIPATNAVEVLLDERYDDDWMEARWPNMILK